MAAPEPPTDPDLTSEFAEAIADAPADERVYRVALQLYEPTRVATVAERADCAPDTARRHLSRLLEIGVLDRPTTDPTTYRRNEAYFEWRKRARLTGMSASELQDRLAELTSRERAFREQYDTDRPEAVDALDHVDYDAVEDVWLDINEWQTVRRRIRRLEAVRRGRTDDAPSEAA